MKVTIDVDWAVGSRVHDQAAAAAVATITTMAAEHADTALQAMGCQDVTIAVNVDDNEDGQ